MKTFLRFLVLFLASPAVFAQTYTFNPLNPIYGNNGAKCDGTSDDTKAFNDCLQAAQNAGGGVCMVPATVTNTCVIASQIMMDGFSGVVLAGPPASIPSNPTLLFTGGPSSAPLIAMRSTTRVSIRNLNLIYNNPAFNGTFIDLTSPAPVTTADPNPPGSSQMDLIADTSISGTPTATGATLMGIDKAINLTVERSRFSWGAYGIAGAANTGSFANVIHIRDNQFQAFSAVMIMNLGGEWTIEGNTFEMVQLTGPSNIYPVAIDANFVPCTSCVISGNFIGDTAAQFNSSLIQGQFPGTLFTANFIQGGATSSNPATYPANGMALFGGSGTTITGNAFYQLNLAFWIPNAMSDVAIEANNYFRVGTLMSGQPTTGVVADLNGNRTFYGNVNVTGTLIKSAGTFKIDHPLDPANKYLSHSFVESPDMMNIYNGIVTLDSHGQAPVEMPAYFEALNRDFRYQLTCIGGAAPVYIAEEMRGNRFRIAGGHPGLKVSWQVTGVRHDAYADAHRVVVEEAKPAAEKGHFLSPESFTLGTEAISAPKAADPKSIQPGHD